MYFKKRSKIKSAFVLGSTSEIAKAICIELANNGCKRFHLLARDLERNQALISKLKLNYKAIVSEELFDLLDEKNSIPDVENFDLYLIASGFIGDQLLASENIYELKKITSINYTGILRWLIAITTEERLNRKSRLWILSSVAGDIGKPSNYSYGAAKSALTIFSQGLYLKSRKKLFSIRIFKAGYVLTRMTDINAPRFFCIKPSMLAKIILKNPDKQGIEYLPWWWFIIIKILSILPESIISNL